MDCPLPFRPHVFDRVLSPKFVFTEPFLCSFLSMFGLIFLLEGRPTTKSQLPGRGNLVFGGIHYANDLNKSPWTTDSKTAPKHK